MLEIETDIIGKNAVYGDLRKKICDYGFCIGGNWDYDRGSFDTILYREAGETIYLRLPFTVTKGELDSYNTHIQFLKPYVIKHITHVGLDYDGSSLLDATGFSQFQNPIDQDAQIINKNRWIAAGEKVIEKVLPYVN